VLVGDLAQHVLCTPTVLASGMISLSVCQPAPIMPAGTGMPTWDFEFTHGRIWRAAAARRPHKNSARRAPSPELSCA
jgi:hypothetical protein